MATGFQKSLATDFNGQLDQYQLRTEIVVSAILTPLLEVIVLDDQVDINFTQKLTGDEITILDSIITNHQPIIEKSSYQEINLVKTQTTNASYTLMSSFYFLGFSLQGSIRAIDIIGQVNVDNTYYDLRVIDQTNNQVIAEKNGLNNTNLQVTDLGPIANMPENGAFLEVQARRTNGSGIVTLQNIYFYF